MYLAALLSAGMLGCQILALWFIMLACQIGLPLWTSAVALLILRLGTTMPNAPALSSLIARIRRYAGARFARRKLTKRKN